MNHIVYLLTDNTNGKIYVGYTRHRLNKRWSDSKLTKRFGHSDFGKEILFDGLDRHSAKEQEIEIIKERQSNNPSIGYNLNEGGGGSSQHTEETKKKLRALMKGRIPGNKGTNHTEESKVKISESLTGEKHPKSKLTESDVLKIRERASKGESFEDISKDFLLKTGSHAIRNIVRRKSWKHI
jgi:predicted GIY-YIG superfamily endonuclease